MIRTVLLGRCLFSRMGRPYSSAATPPPGGMAGFTDTAYNATADASLERVADTCDALSEDYPDAISEVNYDSGVLQIDTSAGSYVLNKQAPKLQMWLSSPLSGPFHYNLESGAEGTHEWLCDKDRHSLADRLGREISGIVKQPVSFT